MTPIETKTTNLTMKAPKDWDVSEHGECKPLPVACEYGVFYSYWKFSFSERIKVLFGRPLRLAIHSSRMPPVALEIPNKEEI